MQWEGQPYTCAFFYFISFCRRQPYACAFFISFLQWGIVMCVCVFLFHFIFVVGIVMCVCVFHFIFVVGDSHACQSFLSVHLFNVDYMFFLNLLRLVIIFFIFLYLYLLNTNMLISKVFGYLGGIGTTISFLPQVVKIYKQNNNDGLSIKLV